MTSHQAKVIIITGASRGIGHAIAKFLLEQPEQHRLILTARSEDALLDLASQFSSPRDRVVTVTGDLADEPTAEKVVQQAIERFGRLDGLVLNHGTLGEVTRIVDCDVQGWRRTFETNLFSCIALLKPAIPELRKTHGRIVLTSSGAAINGYSTWGAYGASKATLNHLALTLKAEEPDIISISIRPGIVDSEMQREIREVHHERMDEKDRTRFKAAHEEGKLLRPEQPGHVIARLTLAATEDLNGQFLNWNDEKLKQFQD